MARQAFSPGRITHTQSAYLRGELDAAALDADDDEG